MKIKRHSLLFMLVGMFSISCTNHNFSIPKEIGEQESQMLKSIQDSIAIGKLTLLSIAEVKQRFFKTRKPSKITGDYVMKAYVTSSDEQGNFYKEVYLQDQPEKPIAGIKLAIDNTSLFHQFNVGREVYIRLKGLYIGETRKGDKDVTVGGGVKENKEELTLLSKKKFQHHIIRSQKTKKIIPIVLKMSEVNERHLGLYVLFENTFFSSFSEGETYVAPLDDYSTMRELTSCEDLVYYKFNIETSAFASFGAIRLPIKGGSIQGVITKNYNRALRMVLNSADDVIMDEKKCQVLNRDDFKVLFEEDFETPPKNTPIRLKDWTNYNEKGTRLWKKKIRDENGYASFSGFRSKEAINIGWLITPKITLENSKHQFLIFDAGQHHVYDADKNSLEVLFSVDYDGGKIEQATWYPLKANLPTEATPAYKFHSTGLIDLSLYSGNLFIAFKSINYGKNKKLNGSYMIDNIQVLIKKK